MSGPVSLPPMSAEWYDWVERKRYARHGDWIPRLLEFARHPGEQILCLGDGLGTDWIQYARRGAQVTVCGRDADHLALLKHPFAVRGLPGKFARATEPVLPAPDRSIDVAVAFRPWFAPERMAELSAEMFRVLRPGGRLLVVVPAHYSVGWWESKLFPWERWLRPPVVGDSSGAWSGRGLKKAFGHFHEHRIRQRHLRRSDLPHLWRWMVLPLVERFMGRYLILKAFKPLRSAMVSKLAA